ncbi:type III-B CRISPR-associated protein Cas10/Cmr2 [Nocardiopsis sp. RSe5-2]|uniref:Type III-B CRISPR-associated protein Cas10/Cmr2 n=1 Tax=Nocardiopsis endophytica TaxID=3018445 RepID=A0ABT4U6H4_9ACTN|nr:type III-B CRISPR-associated protein Cas10/Cmr2 [Nocardiopsis endophytica]MDA2812546.1 type III-B CRISPR-associated protein Cas10/Cmr2 [Nocardiopsis endophytica]
MTGRDLVVVALAGVQRYIEESRTTTDLRSGSQIIAGLAAAGVECLAGDERLDARIVFPVEGRARGAEDGMPNRIVALVAAGAGPQAAEQVRDHLDGVWAHWVGQVFGEDDGRRAGGELDTPGWPVVQWVSVPAEAGGYAAQWHQAQRVLAGRKNIRDFAQPLDAARPLCTLSPRWRSVPPPRRAPEHMRSEDLSVPSWVKRLWHRRGDKQKGFPSTKGIASAHYRAEVLRRWDEEGIAEAVAELKDCVDQVDRDDISEAALPGLPDDVKKAGSGDPVADWFRGRGAQWVYPGVWHLDSLAHRFGVTDDDGGFETAVGLGAMASKELARAGERAGLAPPSPHLAVLVQDLDSMGNFLSGRGRGQDGKFLEVTAEEHGRISRMLSEVAAEQRSAVEKALGTVVYAGGDDLLALVPASHALDVARACHDTVRAPLPTASTGLLFFHHDSSLREALHRAHELLEEAKRRKAEAGKEGKHGLGIGYIRNSGAHADCVVGWADGAPPEDALRVFTPQGDRARIRLSPRLLADLIAERAQLDGSADGTGEDHHPLPREIAQAEMCRLVERHTTIAPPPGGSADPQADKKLKQAFARDAVAALARLAPGTRLLDEDAVRVAVFLRQEVL